MGLMSAASRMTDAQLVEELDELEKKFNAFRDDLDEGHGGSPGEWITERMGELETEQVRRAAAIRRRIYALDHDTGEVFLVTWTERSRSGPQCEAMGVPFRLPNGAFSGSHAGHKVSFRCSHDARARSGFCGIHTYGRCNQFPIDRIVEVE